MRRNDTAALIQAVAANHSALIKAALGTDRDWLDPYPYLTKKDREWLNKMKEIGRQQ